MNWTKSLNVFFCVMLLLVAFGGCSQQPPVSGEHLTSASRIDDLRSKAYTLTQEPTYQADPKYALLIFGRNADAQKWLVWDGKRVYLDRNGNGDLTETGESIEVDEIASQQQKIAGNEFTRFDIFKLGDLEGAEYQINVWIENPDFVPGEDDHEMIAAFRAEKKKYNWAQASLFRTSDGPAQIPVILCPSPADAQISHVDGPLTYTLKWGDRQALYRNSRTAFDINIGTPGVPTSNSTYPIFTSVATERVPESVVPTAIFKFANQKRGGDPIVVDCQLDLRC